MKDYKKRFMNLMPREDVFKKIETPFLNVVLKHTLGSLSELDASALKNKMVAWINATITYINNKTYANRRTMHKASNAYLLCGGNKSGLGSGPDCEAIDTAGEVAVFAIYSDFSSVATSAAAAVTVAAEVDYKNSYESIDATDPAANIYADSVAQDEYEGAEALAFNYLAVELLKLTGEEKK